MQAVLERPTGLVWETMTDSTETTPDVVDPAVAPAVDAAVSIIDLPGRLSGPKLGKLDFWRDVVPEDRLRSGN